MVLLNGLHPTIRTSLLLVSVGAHPCLLFPGPPAAGAHGSPMAARHSADRIGGFGSSSSQPSTPSITGRQHSSTASSMPSRWRLIAFFILLVLSAWNLFVILPAVVITLSGGEEQRSAQVSRSSFASDASEQVPVQRGTGTSDNGVQPFSKAALAGWRLMQQRQPKVSDGLWARRVVESLWCAPVASAPSTILDPAIDELTSALVNRSQLDRNVAALGCRHACDDARLRGGTALDERGQPVCGYGLCVCDGGLSWGLDQTQARDEPSAAFYAAQVVWSPAELAHRLHAISANGNSSTPATSSALAFTADAGSSAAASAAANAAGALGPPREPTLRDLRRHDSVYSRSRHELAASAIPRSVAFAATGVERGTARHKCAHLGFAQAFRVSVRPPEAAPRFAEIIIAAKPALVDCRRAAMAAAAAAAVPAEVAAAATAAASISSAAMTEAETGSPVVDDADGMRAPSSTGAAGERGEGGGSATVATGLGGDTFVVRAYSADIVLQPPVLREQPSRDRYAGHLFIADGGTYSIDIYWTNYGFGSWFDVNEIESLMGTVAAAGSDAPAAAAAKSTLHAAASFVGTMGGAVGVASATNASVATGYAALCPTNNNLFMRRLVDERLPSWTTNFSVAAPDEITRPLAAMPPPRACTSASTSGRWVGSDWAPFTCYTLRYTSDRLLRCASRRPLRIELYGDSIMRGLYFDLAEVLTEQTLDRGWAKRHAGPGKGKRLTVTRGEVTISWAWWTLNAAASHDAADLKRLPPPPGLSNWSLADRNAVILFGSAAHNMRCEYTASFRLRRPSPGCLRPLSHASGLTSWRCVHVRVCWQTARCARMSHRCAASPASSSRVQYAPKSSGLSDQLTMCMTRTSSARPTPPAPPTGWPSTARCSSPRRAPRRCAA